MGQKHASRPGSNPGCLGGDAGYQDFRRWARKSFHAVMFGDPVALVPELICKPGKFYRVAEGIRGCRSSGDWRLIENRELHFFQSPRHQLRAANA